jgi:hypothetical protein
MDMSLVPAVGFVTIDAMVLPFRLYWFTPVPGIPITALFLDVAVPTMPPVVENPMLSLKMVTNRYADLQKEAVLWRFVASFDERGSPSPAYLVDSCSKCEHGPGAIPVQHEVRV